MKTCNTCKHSSYSGGQEQLADNKGVKVETLNYKYCIVKHDHVYKNESCNDFKPLKP